jgi:peptidyl-prolyl cis-trans isomerase C
MASAKARHILVKTEEEASELKTRIDGGESFAEMAKLHSSCPSGKEGGSLGEFSPGQMVKEFDTVVFGDLPVGQVSEPIQTQFGYHLIEVEKRIG